MKFSLLLLLAACAVGAATALASDSSKLQWSKQKFVFDLLQHVQQTDILAPEWQQIAAEDLFVWFDKQGPIFGEHTAELVSKFRQYYAGGQFQLDGEQFNVMSDQLPAVKRLVLVFLLAEDWPTFQRIAVWSRVHVHDGMFVYAMSMAVTHRPDLVGIVLPAQYEIYPHMFYTADVIAKAQLYKAVGQPEHGVYAVDIRANYTFDQSRESLLTYFTEDVGLNQYYLNTHLTAPFWLNTEHYPHIELPRRGERFLFELNTLLARYRLERLSNGLGAIPTFSFYQPIESGYDPQLRYYDGSQMSVRPHGQSLYTPENYYLIERYYTAERRLRDTIEWGSVKVNGSTVDLTGSNVTEALELLGNLLQANPLSPNQRYYAAGDMFAHQLLTAADTGLLEQYETSLRDPMFYQLYDQLLQNYWLFVDQLPGYTQTDLQYNDVSIAGVEINHPLNTSFAVHHADITQAVGIDVHDADDNQLASLFKYGRRSQHKGADLHIRSEQPRLQHDPFAIKLILEAEQPAKVLIKTFLGPQLNGDGREYTLNEMRQLFVEVDEHVVDVKLGTNEIKRNCTEFSLFSGDRRTFYELYEKLGANMDKEAEFEPLESVYRGLPLRLLLPKGTNEGFPLQFFFHVVPVIEGVQRSFGFPWDRKIDNENQWKKYYNMFFFNTEVFHKEF